ncbi:flagellar biosynthetic protein FliR [Desertibacillus haloalkaliphilus]|uniref:flagellar biosynthetic protein FliR n=1 Tax=Desertibacillus haloalkaliphilus TaxID=1328930 RepID=UPI001C26FAE3|nr:flagellar biosynthetic protein FliR [Desertibacillus haloalkaliphilus]MBU8906997.1 flagellar type III secretion system protein FliR [Desertibacillus haloalkaliphilus]
MVEWINQLPAFMLVTIRILAFFTTMPIFSYRNIPTIYKIGLAIYLAWIMIFTLDQPYIQMDSMFFLLIFKEVLVGLMVGLIAMIILYAIQVAGGFIDMMMGFMIANVVDPQTGAQTPLTGGYLYTFAILLLVVVDAHHLLLDGIYYSYQFIPIDQLTLPFGEEAVVHYVLTTFTTMFIIAFQMAFPIVGTLFLVDVALGMVSRAVPQMNVFVVGMPLKILVGLLLLMVTMPVFIMLIERLFGTILETMRTFMQLLGGL